MNIKSIIGLALTAIIGLVGLVSLFGSFQTIDQGERGVLLRNGKVVEMVLPGLHFKMPIVDTIKIISAQNKTVQLNKVEGYSADTQPATMIVSVTYKIDESQMIALYKQYGSISSLENRAIGPRVLDGVKNVFGKYRAAEAIQERSRLVSDIATSLRELLEHEPLTIVSIQLEELAFSDVYEKSVEQKQLAEVMVLTSTQNAKALKEKAQGEKDAAILKAEGQASAVKLAGDAEAEAIRAKAKALEENPGLVDLITAERWDGKLPASMVPGSAVPFVNVK